jgi:hypothetical protein
MLCLTFGVQFKSGVFYFYEVGLIWIVVNNSIRIELHPSLARVFRRMSTSKMFVKFLDYVVV